MAPRVILIGPMGSGKTTIGRLMAARKLGMDKVPVIQLSGMTPTQKKAYIIADNQLAMNGGWDTGLLMVELTELGEEGFDLDLLGFDSKELFSSHTGMHKMFMIVSCLIEVGLIDIIPIKAMMYCFIRNDNIFIFKFISFYFKNITFFIHSIYFYKTVYINIHSNY